jgi:hypothetical protein
MYSVDVYKDNDFLPTAKIEQLKVRRSGANDGIYNCPPMLAANNIAYGIYFEQDISFTWDGNGKNPAKGIEGKDIIGEDRGGSVTFHTNLIFKTDDKTSMFTMQVPNQELEDATLASNLLSTSFFTTQLPVVWRLHVAKKYFVPAGTYIAAIMPISLSELNNSEINFYTNTTFPFKNIHGNKDYIKLLNEGLLKEKPKKFYQKGIDHLGNKIGKHEVNKLNLIVNYMED